jgi:hypothetical protein
MSCRLFDGLNVDKRQGLKKKNWKSLQKKTKNNKLFDGLNVGKGRA